MHTVHQFENMSDPGDIRNAIANMFSRLQVFEGLKGLDFQPTLEKIGYPKCFTSAFQLDAMTNARDLFDDASEFHDALIDAAMEQSMEQCEWGMEQCDSGDEGEVGMAMDEAYLEDCE